MQSITGIFVRPDSVGEGAGFILRTTNGDVRVQANQTIPMRPDDGITVVSQADKVLAIINHTNTLQEKWFHTPPYLPEKTSLKALFFLNFLIGVLAVAGYGVAEFHFPLVGTSFWCLAAWIPIAVFLIKKRKEYNHNSGLSAQIREMEERSALDETLWEPRFDEEQEPWQRN